MIKIESVFIVDDEPSLQFFYEQVLTIGNFEVAGIASNGIEAVSMFKSLSNKPKVILMDQRMPEMSGLEASRLILQIDNRVKIIFITADSSVKEEAISIGVFLFIDKIFTIDELIVAINRAIKSYASLMKN
ncbi:MAG: response regulator [Candidatus Lokiarchaeota archaeon]|nr:response regulator [Candidatus Lokiarchaeota archaeon]